MNNLSSAVNNDHNKNNGNNALEWRRSKVQELSS
jgi:hypothetical protein